MNQLRVSFGEAGAAIRPLNGVNSGPKTYCFYRDTTPYFKEAGIPFSRLHDTEYPYGSGAFVDIPCIFRSFDADPENPNSYDFSQTDLYIQAILDAGAKPIYRLGVSIEHSPVKRNIFPPADPEKWSIICEHIVAHYNEGWANGMHAGIDYWEIWNEPEIPHMWQGTREQLFDLYARTSRRLKTRFPYIKVGGYASCGFYYISELPAGTREEDLTDWQRRWKGFVDWAEAFLNLCAEEKLPLDFFSWHLYGSNPDTYAVHARYVRQLLDSHGFTATESVLDEWNLNGEDMFNRMRSAEGAAYTAAVMCQMQANQVDVGAYYDSQPAMPYCGIFYQNTSTPTPAFYPFVYWNRLRTLGTSVTVQADPAENLYAAAARSEDGDSFAVLISHHDAGSALLTLSPEGLLPGNLTPEGRLSEGLSGWYTYTITGTDGARVNGKVDASITDGRHPIKWIAPGWGAYLVELKRRR